MNITFVVVMVVVTHFNIYTTSPESRLARK